MSTRTRILVVEAEEHIHMAGEDARAPRLVQTVCGRGYSFAQDHT